MTIIILDIVFVIGMVIFGFSLFKLLVDNILLILLAIAVLIVLVLLFRKWPKTTVVVLAVFLIVTLCVPDIEKSVVENSIPVQLYRASGECKVYDIDHNIVTIPAGAIIARYTNSSERQNESVGGTLYASFASMCYWYYEGETHSIYVSAAMDSQWRTEIVKEISYKEFKRGYWWENL